VNGQLSLFVLPQVNAVAPGVIGDSGTHRYAKEVVEGAKEKIPLRRHGKAVEVAYLATFLASPMASYITGQVYSVPLLPIQMYKN
jgi:NAD(P)-dependent dehydrogenase (short-subunit alcohol dehydrogenase family)